MTRLGTLVVGPAGHGVVEVARATARGTVVVIDSLAEFDPAVFAEVDAIHTHYTDRLFGSTVESAAAAFTALVAGLHQPVTVTLHDLPLPGHEPAWRHRRQQAYCRISRAVAGVVVSSSHEAEALCAHSAPVAVIPLPIERAARPHRPGTSTGEVAVLGWIYPGKGHLDVLAALPQRQRMAALGGVSPGHDDLREELLTAARGRLRVTGYLSADALQRELGQIAIPVAPNHQVSASASVGSWLGAGRRPLVADGAWARELAARCPAAVSLYAPGTLREALLAAMECPESTWLGDTAVGPTSAEVAGLLEVFTVGVL